jgi:hypothetical protein
MVGRILMAGSSWDFTSLILINVSINNYIRGIDNYLNNCFSIDGVFKEQFLFKIYFAFYNIV